MSNITSVTYKQRRLRYFREQLAHQERRLDYWVQKLTKVNDLGLCWVCQDVGEEVSFYQSIVQMLEEEMRQDWINNEMEISS